MDELTHFPDEGPSAVETADGVFLCNPDGTIIERLYSDECSECGDTGPWIDEATELCEMCYDHIMGPDDDDTDD